METILLQEKTDTPICLVFSPHPDDDVIGMGGTMAKIAKQRPVWTVYATHGAGSLRKESPEAIIHSREAEALDALKHIGGSGAFFMRSASHELQNKEEFANNLRQILLTYPIDSIYMTSPFERHATHLHTSEWALKVIAEIPKEIKKDWKIFGYSVWGSIISSQDNLMIEDITETISIKEQAILCHQGEVAYKPYHKGVLARNYYEAIYEDAHSVAQASYIEIFLKMNDFLTDENLTLATFGKKQVESFFKELSIK